MQMREIEFPAHSLSATVMFVGVLLRRLRVSGDMARATGHLWRC